ncbi:TonB family protein [bacterium]|nr:TonB family protein [bacterium]
MDTRASQSSFLLTLLYSTGGHVALFLVLVILGLIPLQARKRITWLPRELQVVTSQIEAEEPKENPKGEERLLDPENARPEAIPTPKPTPVPTPKPTPRQVIEVPKVTPTPTPTDKTAQKEPAKKVVATPTPTPQPRPKATPKQAAPEPKKETLRPTPQPTPRRPAPAPKGSPTGAPSPSTSTQDHMLQTEAGVFLPYSYKQQARDLFERNFQYPVHYKNRARVICTLRFKVRKDGLIYDIDVVETTGNEQLNRYARDALLRTHNLPPLPADVKRDYITVSVTFSFGK